MLTAIHPKIPMRDKSVSRAFYLQQLGFSELGREDYDGYLMVKKDDIELHLFEFKALDPFQNYGQVYIRTSNIEELYQQYCTAGVTFPAAGHLQTKPWGQKEFAILDPDHNLLTFGQSV